jgi:hypothetical protein
MTLQDVIDQLQLRVLTQPLDFSTVTPTSGYTSDLLSCVMAGAKKGAVWITLQAHLNIVAVAALLEMSAIIITEDAQADPATIARANAEGIVLLATDKLTFEVVGRLWDLGLR